MADEIAASGGRALQRRKAKAGRGLSERARRTFLDHLAATCNVQASALAAGFGQTHGFYRLRGRDDAFAAAWRDAMRIGYDRLEEALLARALQQVGVAEPSADADAVAIELIDGREGSSGEERGEGAAGAANRRHAGLRAAAGLPGGVARVDVQLALAMLNRQAAIARNGPERRRRQATAEEVAAAIADKLDRLAARLVRHQA